MTTSALKTPGPQFMARSVKNIPSGPRILPRLQRLLADANSSLEDIIAPIRLDQGIATRVLQMSNSAYYSKGTHCQTVEESINRIGFRQVYNVVSNALCSESLVRPLKSYNLKAEDFWKLSVAGGLAAEQLAVLAGQDRNVAYTIGLLHGLGMVVVDNWFQETAPATRLMYRSFEHEFGRDEAAQMQFTQAEAAAALLRHWEFPAEMVMPIQLQYAAEVPTEHRKMVAVLRLAKWLRNLAAGVYPPPPEFADPDQLHILHLTQTQMESLLDDLRHQMQETRDMLAGGK
ncbi:MAG TPA: HDOD domain-containing protein [Lacunisphaera sp.]|nr:HDOD domain-containing protein [Lacunisphaera sp.]